MAIEETIQKKYVQMEGYRIYANGIKRDNKGLLLKGQVLNKAGRVKDSLEQKAVRKALKDLISEHKERLLKYLPLIDAKTIKLARKGDTKAIAEFYDRVLGRPQQFTDITTLGKELPTPIFGMALAFNQGDKLPESKDIKVIKPVEKDKLE